jgi:hypothetical protein
MGVLGRKRTRRTAILLGAVNSGAERVDLMLTLGDRPGSTRLHGSLRERPSVAANEQYPGSV